MKIFNFVLIFVLSIAIIAIETRNNAEFSKRVEKKTKKLKFRNQVISISKKETFVQIQIILAKAMKSVVMEKQDQKMHVAIAIAFVAQVQLDILVVMIPLIMIQGIT